MVATDTPYPLAGRAWLEAPESRRVLTALTARGRPARFVGGCVRDGLLGTDQAGNDLDLATAERPEEVMTLLESAGLGAIPTGLAHGTVTSVLPGWRFEITTLRSDVTCDGRHAVVAFTDDFEADAARRDFTINAMSCDGDGRLFDYFGGRVDLAAGRVRFVGPADQRIAEDALRILRFFRFLAHYGRLPADPEALRACSDAAGAITRLSGERIQTEMMKLLAAADPLPALRLMAEAGVLAQVTIGAHSLDRLSRLLELAPDSSVLLRLGALLRGHPEAAAALSSRWRMSSRDAERLRVLVQTPLPDVRAKPQARRRALHQLGVSRYADLVRLAAAEEERDPRDLLVQALGDASAWTPRSLPLTGHDAMSLGVEAGPTLGALLAQVEDWWIENDFQPDHEACLAYLMGLISHPADDQAPPSP